VAEIFVDQAERKPSRSKSSIMSTLQGREITLIRKDGTSIVA